MPDRSTGVGRGGGGCPGQAVDNCSLLVLKTKIISKRVVPSDKILHCAIDNNAGRENIEKDR